MCRLIVSCGLYWPHLFKLPSKPLRIPRVCGKSKGPLNESRIPQFKVSAYQRSPSDKTARGATKQGSVLGFSGIGILVVRGVWRDSPFLSNIKLLYLTCGARLALGGLLCLPTQGFLSMVGASRYLRDAEDHGGILWVSLNPKP